MSGGQRKASPRLCAHRSPWSALALVVAMGLCGCTIVPAYRAPETSMAGYVQERERRDALARSVQGAQKSVSLVEDLYKAGLTNFQNVLDMQRSLFNQQDQLAAGDGEVTRDLIRLYKALGGGWSTERVVDADEQGGGTMT